jgi:hypothetical protein
MADKHTEVAEAQIADHWKTVFDSAEICHLISNIEINQNFLKRHD